MTLFDNENPVFINDRPKLPDAEGKSEFSVRLHYEGDGLIERNVYSSMINACEEEERFGLEQTGFWVSLPHVKGADLIQLVRGSEIVFEQRLAKLPAVSGVLVKTTGDRLDVSWKSNSKGIVAYSAALKLANGKSIPLGMTDKAKKLAFTLEGLPKGGRGRVEITASDGVFSVSVNSKSFAIKANAPLGAIISPTDGAQFAPSEPVSLLASCSDAFGDQLNWKANDFAWRIDGKNISGKSRIELLTDLKPGAHTVELVSKKWGVLSTAAFNVKAYSEEAKRYDELFARLKRQQTEVPGTELDNTG